ncbi:hypothetical protein SLS53_003798 [Cytospora paraplurivora]|uniref:Uncharacterized protein n=1 Tax=Cytospora paraplurivora TaxID=2898453 RepID=A0AAN9YI40_9PEZI
MAHPEPLSTEPPHKRKRDADDSGQQSRDRIPQPPPPQSGNGAQINYLSRAASTRLRLIQGDAEVFSDVLSLIREYEGVLSRHESLAGNLGAKLTGPRLVRAMEGLFEESIRIIRRDPYIAEHVAWLDVVQFAKSNPNEFKLVSSPDRNRYCTFYLKGNQVEITEDDWRLIMSGTLDRFNLAPPQPLEEDEKSELATLEILEERLQVLIKKADEVARKARQLNYHLSGRKAAINSRRTVPSPPVRTTGFQPLNHQNTQLSNPSSAYDLHADLLQQFTSSQIPRIPVQSCTKKHAKCSWKGMMDEEVAWLKREVGSAGGEVTEGEEGGTGTGTVSGGHTPDPQQQRTTTPTNTTISNVVVPGPPTTSYGDRPESNTGPVVAPTRTTNGVGVGTGDSGLRAQERTIPEFGLREQQPASPHADHYRLSHMANVALGAEIGEKQQSQSLSHNSILRGASTPRD